MTFRDEEVALKARAAALRAEAVEIDTELEALRSREAKKESGAPPPPPRPPPRKSRSARAVLVALMALVAVGAGAYRFFGADAAKAGDAGAEAGATVWDGTSPLTCVDGNVELRGRTANLGGRSILYGRHCTVSLTDCDFTGTPAILVEGESTLRIVRGRYAGTVSVKSSRLDVDGATFEQLDIVGADGKGSRATVRDARVTKQAIVGDGSEAEFERSNLQEITAGGFDNANPTRVTMHDGDVAGIVRLQWSASLTATGTTFEGRPDIISTVGGRHDASPDSRMSGTPILEQWQAEHDFLEPRIDVWPTICAPVDDCYGASGVVGNIAGRILVHTAEDGHVVSTTVASSDASAAVQTCIKNALAALPVTAAPGRSLTLQCAYAGPFLGGGRAGDIKMPGRNGAIVSGGVHYEASRVPGP